MTGNDRWRVAAAIAASLLAHLVVLAHLRIPPPVAVDPAGTRLNLLLIPVPGERRATGMEGLPAPAAAPAIESARAAVPRPKADAARPAVEQPARRRQAIVSAGPIAPPMAPPASALADAAEYLGPERLKAHPDFATPFQMNFPRRALEEGRRGVVVVQLMIDEEGRVTEALALPGAAEDFAEAALAGLRAARFKPARAGGGPVKARAYFAVSFVLE